MNPAIFLNSRIFIVPGSLARSPGHVAEQYATGTAATAAVRGYLDRLPPGLTRRWQAAPGGYIVLNAEQHEFRRGENDFRGRSLVDVAWLKLALCPDPLRYLLPVGALLAHLSGWGRAGGVEQQPDAWAQFEQAVESAFRAGYGLSVRAQADVNFYLAEGIAAFLSDRRALNVRDPRLEKLLAATVFDERFLRQRQPHPKSGP